MTRASGSAFLKHHAAPIFFALAFAVSWLTVLLTVLGGGDATTGWSGLVYFLGGFGPSLAALLLTGLVAGRRGVRELLGRLRPRPNSDNWYLIAIAGPLGVSALALALAALLGLAQPDLGQNQALIQLLPIFLFMLLSPLAEEPGWRGFALPCLETRHSALAASLVLGVLWGLWHLPLFLVPGMAYYGSVAGNPHAVGLIVTFLLSAVGLAVVLGWIYNSTGGNLLLVLLCHAAVNTAQYVPSLLGVTDDYGFFVLYTALIWVWALGVILVTRPRRLALHRPLALRPAPMVP